MFGIKSSLWQYSTMEFLNKKDVLLHIKWVGLCQI